MTSTLDTIGTDGLTPRQRTSILQDHAAQDRAFSGQAGQPQGQAKSSYVQRRLSMTFTLGQGTFGETGKNQLTLTGLRMSAAITKAGGASMGQCQARIFGVTASTMNKMSTMGIRIRDVRNNAIAVQAGEAGSGLGLVFEGTIYECWADYNSQPEVSLTIMAHAGLFGAIKPIPPISFRGATDVAVIMAGIANSAGWTFENSGVSVLLSNPYLPGTAWDQAQAAARAADINVTLDRDTLAIWPKDGSRGGVVPLVSPETGLVGYPTYNEAGIRFRTLYNPSINYGGTIEMKSSVTPACGKWVVKGLEYSLESETPGGEWFCDVVAARQGETIVR